MTVAKRGLRALNLEEEQPLSIASSDFDDALALTLHWVHGSRIEVEFPTPLNNQCYVLRSRGYVGQIPLSEGVLLRIRPKVSIDNLFRMLEYAYNLGSFQLFEGTTGVDTLDDLFERLASILAKRVLDRARKGLYRGYEGQTESLPYVRGRILIVPSLRAVMRGSARLECEYEEHTADLDDNRILAWTLYQLPRFRLRRDDVRRQVRQAYRALAGAVEVHSVAAGECVGRFYHRLNEDYQPMHGLCRFFLEHAGPGIESGKHEFIPFVLYMPALFESFVAEWLKANLPEGMHIAPQYTARLDEHGTLAFRIDLVLTEIVSGRVLAVLDTKYKRASEPAASDIQQIVAYATTMKTYNAFLIYPSTATRLVDLRAGEVRVRSLVFDLGRDPDEAGDLFLATMHEALAC